MTRYKGYAGAALWVDLTRSKVETRPLEDPFIETYLGGNGFGTKILWDDVGPEVDPLSPESRLVLATGPLAGTIWPSSGRFEVVAKSPLTGIYGDANSGGHFAPELKRCGFDMVVFTGRAERPVYLAVGDGEAEIRDAAELWGKGTAETERALRRMEGDEDLKVACIGPAGEHGVRYACIQATYGRSAARCGLGAVMGAKNLKAVAARGFGGVSLHDPDRFEALALAAHRKVRENEFTPAEQRHGTPGLVSLMNAVGRFPTKNNQAGHTDFADRIDADALEPYIVKHLACYGCPIACDKIYAVQDGPFAGTVSTSIEYETLSSLGSRCYNHDLPSIIEFDRKCNDLGMDTISAGSVISFAMELFEKGILKTADADGLDLSWGNIGTIGILLERISAREGFGDILAEGTRLAASKIGGEAHLYAMHVKGMELPAQDGRAQQSMGLAHVTSSRGADHLKGFPTIDETGYPGEAVKRYGEQCLPEIIDGTATKHKPMVVVDGEHFGAVVDSVGVCKFGTFFPPALYWADVCEGLRAATGLDIDVEGLQAIGERIYNLQRAYNVREGITRADDTLPERFLKEKSPSMRAKGHVVYLEPMLAEYYELRQWCPESGRPTAEKLRALGLGDVADALGL